jgi:hypothetical protein
MARSVQVRLLVIASEVLDTVLRLKSLGLFASQGHAYFLNKRKVRLCRKYVVGAVGALITLHLSTNP